MWIVLDLSTFAACRGRLTTLPNVSCTIHERHAELNRMNTTSLPPVSFEQCTHALHNPRLSSRDIGLLGEQAAQAWLMEQSWRILDTNWRCRYGELDIIALTPHRTIVFIEVKTRRGTRYGIPEEAVHQHKQINVRRAATQWLSEYGNAYPHIGIRFDVIALLVLDGDVQVHHVVEAF